MDTQHHQKLKEHITKSQYIGIVVNKNPNLDQMAAGLGLYLALKNMGKNVVIASPSDPIVELSNLVGIDKVKRVLTSNGGDLVVSFPYKDGEIDKVSYNIDEKEGFLNIIVKAAEKGLQFSESDIIFRRGGKPLHLLFMIGVPRLTDVSDVLQNDQHKNATVINLDNKIDNQNYGDIIIVSPRFSSLSEHIADFLTLPDSGMQVDKDIAQNLLHGIIFATNDFQDPKTSHLAFEMAGILMRKGAVRSKRIVPDEEHKSGSFTPRPVSQQRPVSQPLPQQNNQTQRILSQQQIPSAQVHTQSHAMPTQSQQTPKEQQSQTQGDSLEQQTSSQSGIQQKQTPADWLQPKVYKGSTLLQ